jgi:hypothetical protein
LDFRHEPFCLTRLKALNCCNILRDHGLSCGANVEQLAYLLFGSITPARSSLRPCAPQKPFRLPPGGSSLKVADEQSRPPFSKPSAVPKGHDWPSLLAGVERRLSVVEELETVVSANLQRASRLRQSILQKAFTGQLIGNEG